MSEKILLGHEVNTGRPAYLSIEEIEKHLLTAGPTGYGKSRLIRKAAYELFLQGIGVCIVDIHGDTADDLLAMITRGVMENGRKELLRRVHHLEFSPMRVPRLDMIRFDPRGLHPEFTDSARTAWLHSAADRLSAILQRKQGSSDFVGQPRLQRMLRNLMIAAGTVVMDRHIPVGDARIFLDFSHPDHSAVMERIYPRLPREVRADFDVLHSLKRYQDILVQIESTLNRIRSFFSPILNASFSSDGTEEVLDLYSIIQRGELLLLNCRESPYFSYDQGVAVAGLFIRSIIDTMRLTPREHRKPFVVICEEAGEIITEDEQRALGAVRKEKCQLWFCGQDLSTFRKKELDMVPKILSQVNTFISFAQRWPEDNELLSRVLFGDQVEFKPLEQEVERHDGYDWVKVLEQSLSLSSQHTHSTTEGNSQSQTASQQQSHGVTQQETQSQSQTSQRSIGLSTSQSQSTGQTSGEGTSESPIVQGGTERQRLELRKNQQGQSTTKQTTFGEHRTQSQGESLSTGISKGHSNSRTIGHSVTEGTSIGHTEGISQGESISVSEKIQSLARIVREKQLTGQLEQAVNDQLEQFRQQIATMPPRRCVVKRGSLPAEIIDVVNVPDSFESAEVQARALTWAKNQLDHFHSYMFVPDLDPTQEDRRIQTFLEATTNADVTEVNEDHANSDSVENDSANEDEENLFA